MQLLQAGGKRVMMRTRERGAPRRQARPSAGGASGHWMSGTNAAPPTNVAARSVSTAVTETRVDAGVDSSAGPQAPATPAGFKGHVLIIGAGPAGLVSALHFAKRGFKVTVAERRARPSYASTAGASPSPPGSRAASPEPAAAGAAAPANGGRALHTYPMAVNPRAVAAIEAAGASPPMLAPAGYYHGSVSAVDGNTLFSMAPASDDPVAARDQQCFLVDQAGLCRQLAAEARRLFPRETGALTIRWGLELDGVDFDGRVATLKPTGGGVSSATNGGEEAISYDLIVGADGANSRLRAAMEPGVRGFKARTLVDSQKTYKTFLLREADGMGAVPGLATDPPRRHLYVYGQRGAPGKKALPRIVAYKREDGVIAGMVTEEAGWEPGALKKALGAAYPTMPQAWVDGIDAQAAARPPSSFSRIVSCNRLAGPRVVLVGDAGHAMTSSLGQGCNTALDSVHTLATTLDKVDGDLDRLPAAYDSARRPDVAAMQQLELMAVLCLPGTSYGNVLQRIWARTVVICATVLGLLLARLTGRVPKAPPARGSARAAAGGAPKSPPGAAMFSAPWAKALNNPHIAPRRITRGMYAAVALAAGLATLFVVAAKQAVALAVRNWAPAVQAVQEWWTQTVLNTWVPTVVTWASTVVGA